jgi:hypothetical protein
MIGPRFCRFPEGFGVELLRTGAEDNLETAVLL